MANGTPSGRAMAGGDGVWRSFGANRPSAAPAAGNASSGALSANRGALSANRNVVSQTRVLSSLRSSLGSLALVNSRFGTNASLSTNAAFRSSSLVRPGLTAPARGATLSNSFNSGLAFNRFGVQGSNGLTFRNSNSILLHSPTLFNRPVFFNNPGFFNSPFFFNNPFFFNRPFFFNNFFFQRPFFGGCFFNCGFGFGFGLGFGIGAPLWPGFGWPLWYDPWAWGWPSPFAYDPYYDSPFYRAPPADNSSGASGGNSRNSANLLLYLKDGTEYPARECWVAGGKLHCTATNGREGVIELDTLDIQRTVDENARRGVPFTLRPRPE